MTHHKSKNPRRSNGASPEGTRSKVATTWQTNERRTSHRLNSPSELVLRSGGVLFVNDSFMLITIIFLVAVHVACGMCVKNQYQYVQVLYVTKIPTDSSG
jgi:hypothetical protein